MSVQLVHEPSIHLVAHTVIDDRGLEAWADAHGLSKVAANPETPLGNLFLETTGSDPYFALDALPEFGGRFCYRSFEKGRKSDAYVANIIEMEHGSVLEHSSVSFAISGVSRSFTHELVRHRAGATPSQESQRYVDASEIRFVVPPLVSELAKTHPHFLKLFEIDCRRALQAYRGWTKDLTQLVTGDAPTVKLGTIAKKRALEAARSMLPNAAETRLVWTMNMRAARHVCALRGGEGADLEIRRVAVAFTRTLKKIAPFIFADFDTYVADDGFEAVRCAHPKV